MNGTAHDKLLHPDNYGPEMEDLVLRPGAGKPKDEAIADYAQRCELWLAGFAEHLATMDVPDELKRWAAYMTAYYGPKVQVHHTIYDNWLIALLVIRYGEALYHWPAEFTQGDINRAKAFQEGKLPSYVKVVHPELMPGYAGTLI